MRANNSLVVMRLKVENFFTKKLKDISTKFNNLEDSSQNRRSGSPGVQNREASTPSPRSTRRRRRFHFLRRIIPNSLLKVGTAEKLAQPPRPKKPLHRRYSFWLAIAGVSGSTIAVLVWGYWAIDRGLPDPADIQTFVREGTLTVKASDGTILQQVGPATRDKLTIDQIPEPVVQAFIAAEDRRFYRHSGVDFQAVVRAMAANLLARDVVEGGSTITQQVARIVFLSQERSLWRKVQEAVLAQKIERELNKEQILERYLNLVYLGSGAYGVADAAWVYFSKPVNKLTLGETATIAGLPPAPSRYSPLVSLEYAKERRNLVLDRMVEAGFITRSDAVEAENEELTLKPSIPKRLYSETPYFTEFVRQELPQLVSPDLIKAGGLTVETTLHYKWQKSAEKTIEQSIKIDGPAEGFAQAALVAIDPRNGEIRAMVGGTDFTKSQFNRVTQAQRQPGSSFKTMVYTTAIAAGFSPYQSYLDAPYTVDGYEPQNYGKKYFGWMPLRDALASSLNVVAVKLLIDVGFDPVVNLSKQMGIKSELMPTYSMALGASEVNLLEITTAYGTIAAEGLHTETHGIRRVLNSKGEVLYDVKTKLKAKRVLDKGTAAIMTWMLENVVRSGTGRPAQLGRPVAGKTGTSEKARDLWFVGYIPQLVVGVWLGNDDSAPTWGTSGTAAYTWQQFMKTVVPGMPVKPFPKLPNLEGRKGMLKAKPVKPARAYNGSASGQSQSSSSQDNWAPPPRNDYVPPAESEAPSPAESAPPPEAAPAPIEPELPQPEPPADPVDAAPPADPVPPADPQPQPSN